MIYLAATDWNEVTAIATGALALLTFGLVIAASIAAVLAKRDIDTQLRTSGEDLRATREATQAAQEMAQRQIEASHRPLLIEVAPWGPVDPNVALAQVRPSPRVRIDFPGGHTAETDPRTVYVHLSGPWADVSVPLRNVGQGLAVIDTEHIAVEGQRLGEMHSRHAWRKRVPPGETTRIVCTPRLTQGEAATYPWVWELMVPYRDFTGGQLTVAVVRLEQRFDDEDWLLTDVKQVAPENIDLRLN